MRGLDKKDAPTGVFFYKQDKETLIKAINYFENNLEKIRLEDCRINALEFNMYNFKKYIKEYINKVL